MLTVNRCGIYELAEAATGASARAPKALPALKTRMRPGPGGVVILKQTASTSSASLILGQLTPLGVRSQGIGTGCPMPLFSVGSRAVILLGGDSCEGDRQPFLAPAGCLLAQRARIRPGPGIDAATGAWLLERLCGRSTARANSHTIEGEIPLLPGWASRTVQIEAMKPAMIRRKDVSSLNDWTAPRPDGVRRVSAPTSR